MPYDRPKRAKEDMIDWAVSTQRISAAGAAGWREMLATGAVTEDFVRSLATPLQADPVPPEVRQQQAKASVALVKAKLNLPPDAPHADVLAAVDKLVTSAARNSARQVDPNFALNPYATQAAAGRGAAYRAAFSARPNVPTLFRDGDLPVRCASGIDPSALLRVPWFARHAVAEAATAAEAEELLQMYSGADGLEEAQEQFDHLGNVDYQSRMAGWLDSGEDAAQWGEAGPVRRVPANTAPGDLWAQLNLTDDEITVGQEQN